MDRKIWALVLFILHPLTALIVSIRNYRAGYLRLIIILFSAFYGFTFYISPNSGADSVRYRDSLIKSHDSEQSILDLFAGLYTSGNKEFDIYQPILTYIVGLFTDNYRVLFFFFGLVFGYFYSNNIMILLKKQGERNGWISILLILSFAFSISIASGINGTRFWTAAHVFIYGLLSFWLLEKNSGLIFCLLSVLFHFSFFVPAIILSLFLASRLNYRIVLFIYIGSLFLELFNFQSIQQIADYLPLGLDDRTSGYINPDSDSLQKYNSSKENRVWFIRYSSFAMKCSFFIISVFMYFKRNDIPNSYLKPFTFSLLLISFINLVSFLPSVGRFYSIANTITLGILFCLVTGNIVSKNERYIIKILSPVFLLYLALGVRGLLEWGSPAILIGNPLIAMVFNWDQGIYALIDELLK